jgi:hypothetical protein
VVSTCMRPPKARAQRAHLAHSLGRCSARRRVRPVGGVGGVPTQHLHVVLEHHPEARRLAAKAEHLRHRWTATLREVGRGGELTFLRRVVEREVLREPGGPVHVEGGGEGEEEAAGAAKVLIRPLERRVHVCTCGERGGRAVVSTCMRPP